MKISKFYTCSRTILLKSWLPIGVRGLSMLFSSLVKLRRGYLNSLISPAELFPLLGVSCLLAMDENEARSFRNTRRGRRSKLFYANIETILETGPFWAELTRKKF